MALKHTDFELTPEQLETINAYVKKAAVAHAEAGEDPPNGIEVKFGWIPGLGRMVTVHLDGDIDGFMIEGAN